jgi:hypothetical protein
MESGNWGERAACNREEGSADGDLEGAADCEVGGRDGGEQLVEKWWQWLEVRLGGPCGGLVPESAELAGGPDGREEESVPAVE